jgi:hypothetical protein
MADVGHRPYRLSQKFQEYREGNLFIDIIIYVGDDGFPAHKLVLAKYSRWFCRYFEETRSSSVIEFRPEFNPQNMLISAINFMYFGTIELSPSNVMAALAIGATYEISILHEMALDKLLAYLPDHENDPLVVLDFCQKSVEYDVREVDDKLLPLIPRHFGRVSRGLIWRSINATMLGELLKTYNVHNGDFDEALTMIDQFHANFPIVSETDRENLASIVDWADPQAHQLMIRHNCVWVPARIQLDQLRRVMRAARTTAHALRERASLAQTEMSRWFPFTWIQSVHDGDGKGGDTFEVEVIDFARTLGRTVTGFNPVQVGLVTVRSSEPLGGFPATAAIDGTSTEYFMSVGTDMFWEVDLGPLAQFRVNIIQISCTSDPFMSSKKAIMMSHNPSLKISCEDEGTLAPVPGRIVIEIFDLEGNGTVLCDGKYTKSEHPVQNPTPIRRVKIRVPDESDAVLRLFDVRLKGEFLI